MLLDAMEFFTSIDRLLKLPLTLDPVPSVAMGAPLNLLLTLQLFHPFLFTRNLLRGVPFLGLAALAQCRRTIR